MHPAGRGPAAALQAEARPGRRFRFSRRGDRGTSGVDGAAGRSGAAGGGGGFHAGAQPARIHELGLAAEIVVVRVQDGRVTLFGPCGREARRRRLQRVLDVGAAETAEGLDDGFDAVGIDLIDRFGDFAAVLEASEEELCTVEGVGPSTARMLHLLPQISRYYGRSRTSTTRCIKTTEQMGSYLMAKFAWSDYERAMLVSLDSRKRVRAAVWLREGTSDRVSLDIKNVVAAAIKGGTDAVVLCHNHPNGVALPSLEDMDATGSIARALGLVNVHLLDHFILTDTGVTRRDFVCIHHIVWREAGREIPSGHALVFRDGNKRNFALNNLELVSRAELMRRNSVHNYGPEIARIHQLQGAITRQINKRIGKHEGIDRGDV